MRAFARLLEELALAPDEEVRLTHLAAYFNSARDPDRGWGLAALAGTLSLPRIAPKRLHGLAEERVDPVLLGLSRAHVGDLAETVALIWPVAGAAEQVPLSTAMQRLAGAGRVDAGVRLAELCDRLGPTERLGLIRLATGRLGTRVSPGLLRRALVRVGAGRPGCTLARLEELWSCLAPPYEDLFHWLEGGPEPAVDPKIAFRPTMRAEPLDPARLERLDPQSYLAEWKWAGLRVQASAIGDERRLYTATGDDISAAFPDVIETMAWHGVAEAVLTITRDGDVAPLAVLEKRLGRKRVSAQLLEECPAHLRVFDLLHDGSDDLRGESVAVRRAALEAWLDDHSPHRTDLSATIPFTDWRALIKLRQRPARAGCAGLMIKHRDAPYAAGQTGGAWLVWRHDPLRARCVLVYAHRARSGASVHSELTFAAWRSGEAGPELVPVGRAATPGSDRDLARLDRWVRENTLERYGPVRAVAPEIVLDVAFDTVEQSHRHKAGLITRGARISRIDFDTPPQAADTVDTIAALIAQS